MSDEREATAAADAPEDPDAPDAPDDRGSGAEGGAPRRLAIETLQLWLRAGATTQSAALAFYTLFSLGPVLVVAFAIAGSVFGEAAARAEIESQVELLMGAESSAAVLEILEKADRPELTGVASLLGVLTLLLGATAVFGQLQEALNRVWGSEGRGDGPLTGFLIKRLFSFGLVLAIGFLLLVSLVLSAAVAALGEYAEGRLASRFEGLSVLFSTLDLALSIGLVTVLVAAMLRILPDAEIEWREVWVGALFTALLFSVGKFLIGFYLGRRDPGSVYGVAGSIVLTLFWIYYSSLLLLLGACFTRVWGLRHEDPDARRQELTGGAGSAEAEAEDEA